jgi:hypothetical protein
MVKHTKKMDDGDVGDGDVGDQDSGDHESVCLLLVIDFTIVK